MATIPEKELEKEIELFKSRFDKEYHFCLELFEYATIRLLAWKYAYYILDINLIKDIQYDGEETSWYIMGRALGLISEDCTSPCVDFDRNHPLANKGIEFAKKFIKN